MKKNEKYYRNNYQNKPSLRGFEDSEKKVLSLSSSRNILLDIKNNNHDSM